MHGVKDDEGAVAVLVAVLMVALLGFGAIVIDLGQVFAERRQLQNGAEAAALAVAYDCPRSVCDAGTGPTSTAGAIANRNANDALTQVRPAGVCGDGPGLSACTPSTSLGAWDCADTPVDSRNFVQVRVRTLTTSGTNLLPPFLVRILIPGYSGTTVGACARAGWGPVGGMDVFPLGICQAEYSRLTSNGTVFGPPSREVLHGKDVCAFKTSTYDGGFGWLDAVTGSDCSVDRTTDWWLAKSGLGSATAFYGTCINRLREMIAAAQSAGLDGALIHIPIYDDYCKPSVAPCGSGEHRFHVAGFGAFRINAFNFGGNHYYPSTYKKCDTDAKAGGCIKGYFEKFVTYDALPSNTATDFGGSVITLTG